MPIVNVNMLEGRSVEEKRALVEKVTYAISEAIKCPKENVTIIISEIAVQHLGKGGALKVDQ